MSKLVRIAPYNPRQGYVKRRHTILKPRPMRFDVDRGWYEVDDEVAEALRKIPQEDRKPAGLRAFLIATDREDAKRQEDELRQASRRNDEEVIGTVEEPIKATRPGTKPASASARAQASETPRTRTRQRSRAKPETDESDESDDES